MVTQKGPRGARPARAFLFGYLLFGVTIPLRNLPGGVTFARLLD